MGTSTHTFEAAVSSAAMYVKTAIGLQYEALLPEDEAENAAQADWASAGEGLPPREACEEIEVALASVRVLLSLEISGEAREKLEHDREVLELRGVESAHQGLMNRLRSLATSDCTETQSLEDTVDQAKAEAYRRYSRVARPDLQLELHGHMKCLGGFELQMRSW